MKISIVIPVLNEIKYLKQCVESIVKQNICIDNSEILIVDGGSTDGTIELIDQLSKQYSQIKYYDNPNTIIPSALNIGIKNASGEYFIRLDAHAEYSFGYIDKAIAVLNESDDAVANVGGVIITKPGSNTIIAEAISSVMSSLLGVGNSIFRTKEVTKPIFVETVPYGCFRMSAIKKIGLFNELEPRNEDLEYNKRLLAAGMKILLLPDIHSVYYSRGDLSSFAKQAFNNGVIVTNRLRGDGSFHNLRHFVPLLFVIYICFSLITIINEPLKMVTIFVCFSWLIYFTVVILFGIYHAFKASKFITFLSTPPILMMLHSVYGAGSFYGLFLLIFGKKK